VVVVDDETSSEEAGNGSEVVVTAVKRSSPRPSSQKSRIWAAMGLEMPSCKFQREQNM
jgi:hypothetical protein